MMTLLAGLGEEGMCGLIVRWRAPRASLAGERSPYAARFVHCVPPSRLYSRFAHHPLRGATHAPRNELNPLTLFSSAKSGDEPAGICRVIRNADSTARSERV